MSVASKTRDALPGLVLRASHIAGRMIRWMWWFGRNEFLALVLLIIFSAGVWGFVELVDEVTEGETTTIDERILLSLRHANDPSDPIGPGWFEQMFRDFTALGGIGVLVLVLLASLGYLYLIRKSHAMLLLLVAVVGGQALSSIMKLIFERPRPTLVPYGDVVQTMSFPSGHSMMAAVTYLTLGALLARVQPNRQLKAYFLIVAILLTLLVGCSRVYLGVHWPTDVLAGWTAGAVWATGCWLVALWLQRRGQVEQDVPEPAADA